MRNRRLLIVLVVMVVVLGVGAGAVYWRISLLDRRALESRALGMESVKAGNHVDALHQVGRYLQRYKDANDVEAMLAYANARLNVPLPNNKHVLESMGMFRRVLNIDSQNHEAQSRLLELYQMANYGKETLDLAADILKQDPDNVEALRAEATTYARQREFDKALERAERIREIAPQDVKNHAFILLTLQQKGSPKEVLRDYADSQANLKKTKAPYFLVKALSYRVADEVNEAYQAADIAATTVIDNLKAIAVVKALLEDMRAGEASHDAATLRAALERRMGESKEAQDLLGKESGLTLAEQHATLLVLKAINSGREGHEQAVAEIVRELDGRADDHVAKAWSPLLKALYIEHAMPTGGLDQERETINRLNDENRAAAIEHTFICRTLLDEFGNLRRSMDVLKEAADRTGDPGLTRQLVQRLYELEDTQGLLDRTDDVNPADQDSSLLAFRAMALSAQGKTDEAKAAIAELETRKEDNAAAAWTPLIKAAYLDKVAPKEMVEVCKASLTREPGNPYFLYFMGSAQEQLGEPDLALKAYEQARVLAPAWAQPWLRSAEILAALGRREDARNAAFAANARAPQNLGVIIPVARILMQAYDLLAKDDQAKLLTLVQEIQRNYPFEPNTIGLEVELLLRHGQADQAKARMQAALEGGDTLPAEAFLELARVSDANGFDLGEACRQKAQQTKGMTPALAFDRAILAYRNGDPEGGLSLLTEAAKAGGDSVDWRMAVAQYKDVIDAADAAAAWSQVSEAAPDNAAVLKRVLSSEGAWRDTKLIGNVIEKLKALTQDEGVTWRVARARLLLIEDPSEKAASEATTLMTDAIKSAVPSAGYHYTMAVALERLGNVDTAIENLAKAVDLEPTYVAARLELVRLHLVRGNTEQAAPHIDALAGEATLSPTLKRRVAGMLATTGQTQRAIDMLLSSYPGESDGLAPDVLLAQLYDQSRQPDKAKAVVDKLLAGSPDAQTISFAAGLYARTGLVEEGRTLLARLDGLDLKPGTRELLRAEFERTHGAVETTRELYDAALAADRTNPTAWRSALDFAIRSGDVARAATMIEEAQAACPEETVFSELAKVKDLATNTLAQPLMLNAIGATGRSAEAIAGLQAIKTAEDAIRAAGNDGAKVDAARRTLVLDLRRLTDQYPRFLPLKLQLARYHSSFGRHGDAVEVASQAQRDFPESAEAAALASDTQAVVGNWTESLRSAQAWRRLAPNRPEGPDSAIARALIELGRPEEAIQLLQPYIDRLAPEDSNFALSTYLYARALIKVGREGDAKTLLWPRVQASPIWRAIWITTAVRDIANEAVATAWLEEVTPLIAQDSDDETMVLARGWFDVADRFNNGEYRGRAEKLLLSKSTGSEVKGSTYLALGIVADRDGNTRKAEEYYRLALKLDGSLTVAKNNLAMILANSGTNLEEATQLASEIERAEPNNASFIDTVGSVYEAKGDYDSAIRYLKRAVDLEPNRKEWRDHLSKLEESKAGAPGAPGTGS